MTKANESYMNTKAKVFAFILGLVGGAANFIFALNELLISVQQAPDSSGDNAGPGVFIVILIIGAVNLAGGIICRWNRKTGGTLMIVTAGPVLFIIIVAGLYADIGFIIYAAIQLISIVGALIALRADDFDRPPTQQWPKE